MCLTEGMRMIMSAGAKRICLGWRTPVPQQSLQLKAGTWELQSYACLLAAASEPARICLADSGQARSCSTNTSVTH